MAISHSHSHPQAPRLRQRLTRLVGPFKRAFGLWSAADGLRMSAAMSFYGILSLAPTLVLIVALLGWWVDREVLESTLLAQVRGVVGEQGARVVHEALASAQRPQEGLVAGLIGFGVLLSGATGVFAELQDALERLWALGRDTSRRQGWRHTVALRLRGAATILLFGLLLVGTMLIAAGMKIFSGWAGDWWVVEFVLRYLNELIGLGALAALLVSLMRLSSGPRPRVRHLVFGAFVGSLLFTLGRQALTFYLSTAAIVSAYGAAGSLVVLLMWMYFSAAVLLFAACCARAVEEGGAGRS